MEKDAFIESIKDVIIPTLKAKGDHTTAELFNLCYLFFTAGWGGELTFEGRDGAEYTYWFEDWCNGDYEVRVENELVVFDSDDPREFVAFIHDRDKQLESARKYNAYKKKQKTYKKARDLVAA